MKKVTERGHKHVYLYGNRLFGCLFDEFSFFLSFFFVFVCLVACLLLFNLFVYLIACLLFAAAM